MSDWPYDETETPIAEPNAPDWECPEGICECNHPDETGEKYEFSVMLFSPEGERMDGARCRIVHHGRVINEDQPNADESGWVTAMVPHLPATVLVEWAPAGTPRAPDLPYRTWYYVDIDRPLRESTRRKLHNLGYSTKSMLEENIKQFQRDYSTAPVTGKAEDIEDDLRTYHDEARLPYTPLRLDKNPPPSKGQFDEDGPVGDVDPSQRKAKAPPQLPPGAPPSKGGTVIGKGSVKVPWPFPSIVEVLDAGEAFYEFVRIHVTSKTLEGFFWIFGDALMWQVPQDTKWKDWTESYSVLPNTPRVGQVTNRMRLCRLPCTPPDAQAAADRIHVTQDELLQIKSDGSKAIDDLAPAHTTASAPCVLPTPNLYDALFLGADVRIQFQQSYGLGTKNVPPPRTMVNVYNTNVNNEVMAQVSKKGLATPPRSLGTPGKIWAAHEDMERKQWPKGGGPPYTCVINYGFHHDQLKNGKPWPEQSPGSQHGADHIDYSQIFVAVAGFCAVKGAPGDTGFVWKRTSQVYMDQNYAPLVNRSNRPLDRYAYEGTQRPPPHGATAYWQPQQ